MNPLTQYLGLGLLIALLATGGFATIQTFRLKAATAENKTLVTECRGKLDTIAASSKDTANQAELDALRHRATQLQADRERSDAVAKEAEVRRAKAQTLLDRLRKERDDEARSNPDSCLSHPVSSGTLERLRALDAGSGDRGS